MRFRTIDLPTGNQAIVPADLRLEFYSHGVLSSRQRQATAYIPWQEHYLRHVPAAHQPFFEHVLPHLSKRTTNVHTALSVGQLPWLLPRRPASAASQTTAKGLDSRLVYLALILHDIGWSKVSLAGIADSLSYSGLALSPTSRAPKEQHVLIGATLAWDILDSYDFGDSPLSDIDKRHITTIIRRHDYDAPWERGRYPQLSAETAIVCDADRLWSYTYENFWQDTVRKDIAPAQYAAKLELAVDSYFLTPQAKSRARQLLAERLAEVAAHAHHRQHQAVV